MLAARDKENLVNGHQQVAASKPLNQSTKGLQPKTPGNRYPKTPLKVPLNDENMPVEIGGRSVKDKGLENLATGKNSATLNNDDFVTPMGPRTRAPLGMKSTNAKAKAFQKTTGPAPEKTIENTHAPQTSARRPKKLAYAETGKIAVHSDESPLSEREVEFCPPKSKDIPYESEVFPNGCLNYGAVKPGNLMRGIYQKYHNPVDANGLTRQDREHEVAYQKSIKEADERVLQMMEEDWTVGDVPETFRHLKKKQPVMSTKSLESKMPLSCKGPATLASRKAASTLSIIPKSTIAPAKIPKPKPATSLLSHTKPALPVPTNNHMAAEVTSRSTLGYNKGRNASSALKRREGGFTRTISNVSQVFDTTVTSARFTEKESRHSDEEWRRLKFLEAFAVDDEDLEQGLRGILPECLRKDDEDDEEFVMTSGFQ